MFVPFSVVLGLASLLNPSAGEPRTDASEPRALPKVLFLTRGIAYVHDVVKRSAPDKLSIAEQGLTDAAKGRFDVHCTQDCDEINPKTLAGVQAVFFMTQGQIPISDANKVALLDWIKAGGAFIGAHCGADTLADYAPYVQMVGGTFNEHPWHQEVNVLVEDKTHLSTVMLPDSFKVNDEIYQFKEWQRHPLHVLLTLDMKSVDTSKCKRKDLDYGLAWCKEWGRGHVFYTALGHEAALWTDPKFTKLVLGGIDWAISAKDLPERTPKGATALFDGKDLASWTTRDGGAAKWKIEDGYAEVNGTGDIQSKTSFGDALYHVEFRVPKSPAEATGQERGNSGVYLQGRYEIQVLDSFGRKEDTGDCGAIYSKKAPDQNACKKEEEWQSYDIRFTAPKIDAGGKKTANARVSVWQNGIPIHSDVEIDGPTGGAIGTAEVATAPLLLQDHGHTVRYRNVWVMPLGG